MSWKVIEILKGIRSSIGSQEVIKSSWKILQRSEKIRSSGLPKFLKGSRKSSKSQENAQKVPKVFRPQVLNWCSKCPQIPQKVIKTLEVLRGPQKVFKATSIPQNVINSNPVVVKSSSNGHQMVLKSVPKNSPQKKSSKVPENQVLRSSKMVHKVLKKSRTKDTQVQVFSNDPQNVKSASNPSKSRSTKGQGDFKVLKNLSTTSKSSVNQVLQNPQCSWNPQRHQVLNRFTRSHQTFLKDPTFKVLRSSKIPQRVEKVLKKSRKCTKGTQGPQTSGSQLILKMSSNSSKGYQSPRSPHRSTKGIQGDFKVLKNLSTSSKSSVGNQVRKILNVLKSHWNPQRHQVLNRFTRSHQKFLKDSSTFWENQVLRSSKIPQRVEKVLTKSRKCTQGIQGPQTSSSQLILKMSSNSSKGHQSPRSPQRSTKGIHGDLNSSKRYQRPQNPVVVISSSNGHQMVLTESSNVPKNSPQMFHKKSANVPERFFNVLRSSCPQVFKKSSKGPQSPQKVKKMHKRYPRSSDLRFSTDPQNVLKFLKRLSKPSKSS